MRPHPIRRKVSSLNIARSRNLAWIALTLVAVAVLLAGGWFVFLREDAYAFNGGELGGDPAPEIALVTQHGEDFTLEAYRGQVVVLYFGYTYCPDFCPVTMLDMMQVKDILGDDASQLQVVMVSVDPERDTPARLAEYLGFYDSTFLGLSGPADATVAAQRDYGVMAAQHEATPGASGYLVDHSTSLFGVDPDGNLVLTWQFGTEPAEIAEDVAYLLED
jgi:protein SCO1/2